MRNSAVLVAGGGGYIGSHVALALCDAGREVVVLDDYSTGRPWRAPPGVTFVRGDIADSSLVAHIVAEHGISAIAHLAASVEPARSVAQPLDYYRNNTVKSHGLIEAAVKAGVGQFIFASSAAVYGAAHTALVGEDAPTRPINPYGASKLMTEMMLRDVAAAHPISVALLRFFNVAGADPQGRLGAPAAGSTHLFSVAAAAARRPNPRITIFGDDYPTPDGTGVRDYIHVSDVARAHVAVLDHLERNPGGALTFNCGTGHGHSVLEVLAAVEAVAGVRVNARVEGRRPGDSPMVIADIGRLSSTLGWAPQFADIRTIAAHVLAGF